MKTLFKPNKDLSVFSKKSGVSVTDKGFHMKEYGSNAYLEKKLPEPQKVKKINFSFYETSFSTGEGLKLYNSNGKVELAVAIDNPEWDIIDKNGVEQIYTGDGYERWVDFGIRIDWENKTFDVLVYDNKSDKQKLVKDRPLKHGVDIQKLRFAQYLEGKWGVNQSDVYISNIEILKEEVEKKTIPVDKIVDKQGSLELYVSENIPFQSGDKVYVKSGLYDFNRKIDTVGEYEAGQKYIRFDIDQNSALHKGNYSGEILVSNEPIDKEFEAPSDDEVSEPEAPAEDEVSDTDTDGDGRDSAISDAMDDLDIGDTTINQNQPNKAKKKGTYIVTWIKSHKTVSVVAGGLLVGGIVFAILK